MVRNRGAGMAAIAALVWLAAACADVGAASRAQPVVASAAASRAQPVVESAAASRAQPAVESATAARAPVSRSGTTHGGPGTGHPMASVPVQQCTAKSGFSASLATDAHGAPTPEGALAAFLARPFEPGYTAALDQWHVTTRAVQTVNYSAGAASLSIIELSDQTWVVISGETCASTAVPVSTPSAAPATTAVRYVDDGVHLMSPPIRRRAAVLLAEWDAQRQSTTPPEYYPDPQQSAVIESASTGGGNLDVSFEGAGGTEHNICGGSYYPTAAESSSAVVVYLVKVLGPFPAGNAACDAVGTNRTVTVVLHHPLSGRRVIDLITGGVVPLT